MIALLASFVTISTPFIPSNGWAVDSDGSIYGALGENENKVSRLVRFSNENGTLKESFRFPQKFEGILEIIPTAEGIIVADYEGGFLGLLKRDGKVVWQTKTRYPSIVRDNGKGTAYLLFGGGRFFFKTSDSSDVEPILDKDGRELALEEIMDIAPMPNGDIFAVNGEGDLIFIDATKTAKRFATIKTMRLLSTTKGGVLVLQNSQLIRVSQTGQKTNLWTLPKPDPEASIRRTGDGRIAIASNQGLKGVIYILERSVEK